MQLFVIRGLIDPLGHPIYTSMIGRGRRVRADPPQPRRFAAIPLGYFGAVLLHGLWNGAATTGSLPALGIAYLVIMGALVGLDHGDRTGAQAPVAKMGGYLPAVPGRPGRSRRRTSPC